MGAELPPESGPSRESLLAELEDYVRDSIITGSGDYVLSVLIDLVISSEREQRPLFPLLEEPLFFRKHIRPWIIAGYAEYSKIEEAKKETVT